MSFWTSFWLTDLHFAIMLAGTIINLIFVYVLFLAWRESKYSRLALRALGFLIFAVFLASYAVGDIAGFDMEVWQQILKMIGLLLIAVSFVIDPVQPPPVSADSQKELVNQEQTKTSLMIASFLKPVFCLINLIFLGLITFRIYIKYSKGLEKEFKNLLFSFFALFLAELVFTVGTFQSSSNIIISRITTDFGPVWIAYHILTLIAFVFIAIYAWGYLRFKLISQVIIAFVFTSLLIFVAVTATYTSQLIKATQRESLESLDKNLKTLNYAVDRLKNQGLATARVFAKDQAIEVSLGDSEKLSEVVTELMTSSGVDFLAIVDPSGVVLARAEESDAISDSLADNLVVSSAFQGENLVNMDTRSWITAPQVYIETAVQMATPAAVYTGYIIDNAFVDGVKNATGLDIAIFADDVKSATTLKASDDVSRLTGVKETNQTITDKVLT